MASYASRAKADVARWREAGLIDASTAERLAEDIETRHRSGISFGSIVGTLAAVLLSAAVLLFVAANWETMPRLARVALLLALIALGYVGGALKKIAGSTGLGEGMYFVAATAFGASLALIGQMYHLSGDEVQAIGLWTAGTAFAAGMLRSQILTIGGVLLATAWMSGTGGVLDAGYPTLWYVPACLLLWLLSFWTRSPYARVLVLLGLLFFGTLWTIQSSSSILAPASMALLSAAVFVFAVAQPRLAGRLAGLGIALPWLGFFGFLLGMALIQIQAEHLGASFLAAILIFAGIVAALLAAGRQSRRLRRLAYAGFVAELVYLYVAYLGTMLDTASFFLASGLVLAALAWGLRRVEQRFAPPASEVSA